MASALPNKNFFMQCPGPARENPRQGATLGARGTFGYGISATVDGK
jgi:hypothetical protein